MKKIVFIILILSIYLQAAINVTVSILPQEFFVKQIAGDLAKVEVMVLPGNEPATYEPKPRQLSHLSSSKIYFSIGVPFEKHWLKKFKEINPKMIISDTSKGIKKRAMNSFYDLQKQIKRPKSDALDPHIWLSPKLVKVIVKNIADTFIQVDPEHKKIYLTNLNKFIKKVTSIQQYAHKKLDNLKHKNFMVFHPVWGYFADEFGLKQIPIQLEGKAPKPRSLIKLIQFAKKKNIKVIFVQPEFSQKSAKTIAENIGAKVITLDPLSQNWLQGIKKAIDSFSTYL